MQNSNDFQQILDAVDAIASKNIKKPRELTDLGLRNREYETLQEHAASYSNFLKTYVNEYKKKVRSQRVMRNCFFVLVNILLVAIIACGFAAVIITCLKKRITTNDVAAVITAVVGAISTFLVLPKVIAENLFPSKEEDKTAELFEKMFNYDTSIRRFYKDLDSDSSDAKNDE